MLTLIFAAIAVVLFVLMVLFLLGISISGIYSGIKERKLESVLVGIVWGLVFLFVVLYPFAYTKNCPVCNKSYSYEYQYCPKDGTKLEE